MKLQRTKMRKIHESQRKIDNEEVSDEEEEEEEEFEDGTVLFHMCFTIIFYNIHICRHVYSTVRSFL